MAQSDLVDEIRATAKAATAAVQGAMRAHDRYKRLNTALATLDTRAINAEAAGDPKPGKPLSRTTTRFLILIPELSKSLEHASSVASLIATDLLAHAEAIQTMPAPEPTTLTAMEQAEAGQAAVEAAAEASKAGAEDLVPDEAPTAEPAAEGAPGLLAETDADEGDFI